MVYSFEGSMDTLWLKIIVIRSSRQNWKRFGVLYFGLQYFFLNSVSITDQNFGPSLFFIEYAAAIIFFLDPCISRMDPYLAL